MKNIFKDAKFLIESYNTLRLSQTFPKPASVVKLQCIIESQPMIRMNLELAIQQSEQTLRGKTVQEFIELINAGIHEPPSFTQFNLVGSPLNIICAQLMQTSNGRTLLTESKVNSAFKDILIHYNQMLKSPNSLKYLNQEEPFGWFSPRAQQLINFREIKCDMSQPYYGFRSWNDFFIRQFKQNARPVHGEGQSDSNSLIVNSCEYFPIEQPQMPYQNIKKNDRFWLKNVNYSLQDIFGASQRQSQYYANLFQGGTIFQAFLDACYYHRWHSPVDGKVVDNYLIQGHYLVDQSQFNPIELDSLKTCQPFLSSVATRRIIVIQPENKELGTIALVYIGMGDISSCISSVSIGQTVKKGEEIGRFEIGGSSHAIIFEPGRKLKFTQLYHKQNEPKLLKVNSLLAELV